MEFLSRHRSLVCVASVSVAALALASGCGSSKSKGSKGADPAPAPVTTTPQAPNPTTVGTGNGQSGNPYPGDPSNPGYPNTPGYPTTGGNYPPNQGGSYPSTMPGNVPLQAIENQMMGRWVSQYGNGGLLEFSAGRRFVKSAQQAPGYPSYPDYGSNQVMQGQYVVNPSVTQASTLGIVLRTAGYPYSSEIPCFVSLTAAQYNGAQPTYPYGPQQETLTLQCAENYQPGSGRQPTFGAAEVFVRDSGNGYFPQ